MLTEIESTMRAIAEELAEESWEITKAKVAPQDQLDWCDASKEQREWEIEQFMPAARRHLAALRELEEARKPMVGYSQTEDKIDRMEAENDSFKQQLCTTMKEVEELRGYTHARCAKCGRDCLPDGDCYGCEADRLQKELAASRKLAAQYKNQRDEYNHQVCAEQRQNADIRARWKATENDAACASTEISNLQQEITELRKRCESKERAIVEINNRVHDDIVGLRRQVAELACKGKKQDSTAPQPDAGDRGAVSGAV